MNTLDAGRCQQKGSYWELKWWELSPTGSREPFLSPTEYYERSGDVPNVVFTTGAILEKNGEVKIYYGACDTSICLATVHIDDLLSLCKKKEIEVL